MVLNDPIRHIMYLPVRFSDLDALGHVNNARYLTFYEEGRTAWFRDAKLLAADSTDFPVILGRVELDYLLPIQAGQHIYVGTRCSAIGTKSITIEGFISLDHKLTQIASRYKCILVYYDYEQGVSVPVPPSFRDKVVRYERGE